MLFNDDEFEQFLDGEDEDYPGELEVTAEDLPLVEADGYELTDENYEMANGDDVTYAGSDGANEDSGEDPFAGYIDNYSSMNQAKECNAGSDNPFAGYTDSASDDSANQTVEGDAGAYSSYDPAFDDGARGVDGQNYLQDELPGSFGYGQLDDPESNISEQQAGGYTPEDSEGTQIAGFVPEGFEPEASYVGLGGPSNTDGDINPMDGRPYPPPGSKEQCKNQQRSPQNPKERRQREQAEDRENAATGGGTEALCGALVGMGLGGIPGAVGGAVAGGIMAGLAKGAEQLMQDHREVQTSCETTGKLPDWWDAVPYKEPIEGPVPSSPPQFSDPLGPALRDKKTEITTTNLPLNQKPSTRPTFGSNG